MRVLKLALSLGLATVVLAGCSIPFTLSLFELLGMSSSWTVTQGQAVQFEDELDSLGRGGIFVNSASTTGGEAVTTATAALQPQVHPPMDTVRIEGWIGPAGTSQEDLVGNASYLFLEGTLDIGEIEDDPPSGEPWTYEIPEQTLQDLTIDNDRIRFASENAFSAAVRVSTLEGETVQTAYDGIVTFDAVEIHGSASVF